MHNASRRPRRLILAIGAIAAAGLLGAGTAVAASSAALSPGSYQSWGPNTAYSGGNAAAQGKGQFGERYDATAVGGTQYRYDVRPGGDAAFVSISYSFYGPTTSCGSGSCWHPAGADRTSNWSQASWAGEYESTALERSGDRARGFFKACVDKSLAFDDCSSESILTTSY